MKTKDETIAEIRKEIMEERKEKIQEFTKLVEANFRSFIKDSLENGRERVTWPFGQIRESYLGKHAPMIKKDVFANFISALKNQGWELNFIGDDGFLLDRNQAVTLFLR